MANNIAMPNQQVPLGSRPSEFGYGQGNEAAEVGVKAVGSLVNRIGDAFTKRRAEIAKGREAHMQEAAANARGDEQQHELNKIYAKAATKLARNVLETDNNTDNFLRIAESGLASKASAGRKATSGTIIPPTVAPQPSAVESPAAKPRTRNPAQTASMRTPLEGGGEVVTRLPIARKAELSQAHERTINGQTIAKPTAKPTTAKPPTSKPTSRAAAPKPPVAKATPKAPASKAPAKNPAARKPRVK